MIFDKRVFATWQIYPKGKAQGQALLSLSQVVGFEAKWQVFKPSSRIYKPSSRFLMPSRPLGLKALGRTLLTNLNTFGSQIPKGQGRWLVGEKVTGPVDFFLLKFYSECILCFIQIIILMSIIHNNFGSH